MEGESGIVERLAKRHRPSRLYFSSIGWDNHSTARAGQGMESIVSARRSCDRRSDVSAPTRSDGIFSLVKERHREEEKASYRAIQSRRLGFVQVGRSRRHRTSDRTTRTDRYRATPSLPTSSGIGGHGARYVRITRGSPTASIPAIVIDRGLPRSLSSSTETTRLMPNKPRDQASVRSRGEGVLW